MILFPPPPIIWLQNAGKFSENVFLLVPNVQASNGVHPFYSVGARGCLAWIKADHSHVELRLGIIGDISLPHMPAWCDFTLLLPNMIRNY